MVAPSGENFGQEFHAGGGAEMRWRLSAGFGYYPEIVGIGEYDLGSGDVGIAKEGCVDLCLADRQCAGQGEKR
jgi:hypothetical protein